METYYDLIPHLFEGVYVVDKNRKIIFWNKSSELITGYKSEEVVNANCFQNILRHVTIDGVELCHNGCPLHNTLKTGKVNSGELFLHHKDGHRIPVSVKTFPVYDDNKNITAAIEVFTDSRERDEAFSENRRLKKMLIVDELTKVYNRRHLDFYLKNIKQEFNEYGTPFGVLFFDIDFFKNVNDTYGHNVGDKVLKLIARTLKANIRIEDVIGRWGGEEFIAVIRAVDENELTYVAEKMRKLVEKSSIKISGKDLSVTVSIGGTMYKKGETIKEVIARADKNMYESKDTGRNKSTIR